MVHVYCQNEGCRMIVHLDDATHWNYKGRVTCENATLNSRLKSRMAKSSAQQRQLKNWQRGELKNVIAKSWHMSDITLQYLAV